MKNLPLKQIAVGCLVMALLVVARCAVTVGKAIHYRMEWIPKLVEDPWFLVGIVAAIVGLLALLLLALGQKKKTAPAAQTLPEEQSEV